MANTLSQAEITAALEKLDPGTPWTHYYNIEGVETIREDIDPKFFKKSVGLQKLGKLALDLIPLHTRSAGIEGLRVLDVASAEGAHSIGFAQAGAKEVVGVEGRQLYVDRSTFIADAMGLDNVSFELGDVRKIDAEKHGKFDFVFCSGILHHLGKDDFLPFLQLMSDLTGDTMMLYTHVTNETSLEKFAITETEPLNGIYAGSLFREHADNASDEKKKAKVRASLDNNFSFWATEDALVSALKDVGFNFISRQQYPHIFGGWDDRMIRLIMIARK